MAIRQTADKLGLDSRDVKKAYDLYWKFFKNHIESIYFKDGLTKEEFESLQPSFNIPSIGKFCCTYDRYLRLKSRSRKLGYAEDN